MHFQSRIYKYTSQYTYASLILLQSRGRGWAAHWDPFQPSSLQRMHTQQQKSAIGKPDPEFPSQHKMRGLPAQCVLQVLGRLCCVRANKAPCHSSLKLAPGDRSRRNQHRPFPASVILWVCTNAEVKHPAFLLAPSQPESPWASSAVCLDDSARFLLASEKEPMMVFFNHWSFTGMEKTGIFWWSLSQLVQTDFSSYWNKIVKFWPALDL